MATLTVAEVQSQLPQIIDRLRPGEEVVITREDRPVARLKAEATTRKARKAGNCQGMLVIVAEDREHLQDFAEYME